MNTIIYHIVTLDELKAQTKDNRYKPLNFDQDGFIHCTAEMSTSLLVLEDYFTEASKSNVILILEIDTSKLESIVKYEPPAPIPGGGTGHIKDGILFPHIYGSINIDSVIGCGKAERIDNAFVWPLKLDSIDNYLHER